MTRALLILLLAAAGAPGAPTAAPTGMARVPAGEYRPFWKTKNPLGSGQGSDAQAVPVPVKAFLLDVRQVNVAEFAQFVKTNPKWRRSRAPRVFVDEGYLKAWDGDLQPPRAELSAPVTQVSWFAANAYCRAQGKRLPSVAEWEYAALEEGEAAKALGQRILEWYGRPSNSALPTAGGGAPNRYGLRDLHAVVWEWTLDFNNTMAADDARGDPDTDTNRFCGAGGVDAVDPADYATFMRTAFRQSLQARYTVRTLGFRCAKELTP